MISIIIITMAQIHIKREKKIKKVKKKVHDRSDSLFTWPAIHRRVKAQMLFPTNYSK